MTAMAVTILVPKRDRETGDPKRVNQTCTEVYPRGSGQRIWNSEKHSPTGGKMRGAKSGGGKIRATDLEVGKPVTHLDNIEDPQTQALSWESCLRQFCRAPCVLFVIDHWYANDLCLVLDQFFSFFE